MMAVPLLDVSRLPHVQRARSATMNNPAGRDGSRKSEDPLDRSSIASGAKLGQFTDAWSDCRFMNSAGGLGAYTR